MEAERRANYGASASRNMHVVQHDYGWVDRVNLKSIERMRRVAKTAAITEAAAGAVKFCARGQNQAQTLAGSRGDETMYALNAPPANPAGLPPMAVIPRSQ